MPSQRRSSLSQKAVAAGFWGFKAFLTMGAFPVTGGIDLLVGLGTQLLAEGVSVLARRTHQALGPSTTNNNDNNNNNSNNQHADDARRHDTYAGAVANMVYAYGSVERFQREVTNFAQFSRQLSTQLTLHGDATGGDAMATAESVYLQFVECDRDGSGYISVEEFVVFCSKMDVSEESARAKFVLADVNGDGKISFQEWTAMMMGRAGRADSSLNCRGDHGLTRYTASISGMSCDFCGKSIAVGSLASGCRRCNCDACPSCSGLSSPAPASTPLQRLPPPSYKEFITKYNRQGGPPPLPPRNLRAGAGSAHAPTSTRFPEQKQRASVAAESPFPFGSVVRVLYLEDDDPHGQLMTVIGFVPSGECPGGDEGGELVLNCRGNVVRAPSFLVSKVDDTL